ncbi:MAG: penicillin-binding transpeptidase domain-containing protein, partial [Bacteroidales bacterium]|nr:penicillin-binding transpeptidase domain-containing protein [Bacteroidales bacterium]
VSYMILLENGKITPDTLIDTGNYDKAHPVHWQYYSQTIRDDHPVGKQTADECIVQSSNIAVAKMTTGAYASNPQAYLDEIDKIGFLDDHALTDSDRVLLKRNGYVPQEGLKREFPGIRSSRHRQITGKSWSKVSLAQISYGYETQIPGIFMLQFYNAIANDGKLVRPYIVDHVEKDGKVTYEQETTVINKKICSKKTLAAVRHALEGVVEHGTAAGRPKGHPRGYLPGAKSDKLKIAGKTGTAQRYNPVTKSYYGAGHNVSFIGYFPADEPEYCGIVVINSYGSGISAAGGGYMAGPVFRNFAEQVYARNLTKKLSQLPKDTLKSSPKVKRGLAAPTQMVLNKLDLEVDSYVDGCVDVNNAKAGIMPNVVGMGANDALLMLEASGFKNVTVNGYGKVVGQSPSAQSQHGINNLVVLTLK